MNYNEIDAMNWSRLKYGRRSMAHLKRALEHGTDDKPAFALGRGVDGLTLTPEEYRKHLAIWTGGRRYGKEWSAFLAANEGCDILTADEFEQAQDMALAVRANQRAAELLTGGEAQVTVEWKHELSGVRCKGRIDYAAREWLVDLKTARDASPSRFGAESYRLGYHIQAAMYRDGFEAMTGKRLPFFLVVVEKEPPYLCQVYRVPDALLDAGQEEYRDLLCRYAYCRANNQWLGYSETGELELELPRWMQDDDEDLGDLGLEFNSKEAA